MRIRCGHFTDFWRGNGWFVSLGRKRGWLLVAFRPTGWRLRIVRPTAAPTSIRVYVGPVEIEVANG